MEYGITKLAFNGSSIHQRYMRLRFIDGDSITYVVWSHAGELAQHENDSALLSSMRSCNHIHFTYLFSFSLEFRLDVKKLCCTLFPLRRYPYGVLAAILTGTKAFQLSSLSLRIIILQFSSGHHI